MDNSMSFGTHLLIDLFGVDFNLLNDSIKIEEVLVKSAEESGATVLNIYSHIFKPQGVSCNITLSESHLTIHTFPEYNSATLDLYTCGNHVDPEKGLKILLNHFKPREYQVKKLIRGNLEK